MAAAAVLFGLLAVGANGAASPGLDLTWPTSGKRLLSIDGYSVKGWGGVVQPDGKPILLGRVLPDGSDLSGADLFMARFNTNGSLDTSFGDNGIVKGNFGGYDIAQTAIVSPVDGSILVGGSTQVGANDQPLIAKYNADGTLDTSWGPHRNGYFTQLEFGGTQPLHEVIAGLAFDRYGNLVALDADLVNGGFALLRFNPQGLTDPTYSIRGDEYDLGVEAGALAEDGSGNAYVAGAKDAQMAVWKFGSNGYPVNSWGTLGVAYGAAPARGSGDDAYAMVLQPDGSVVTGGGRGYTLKASTSNEAFALERFTSSGALDSTFGSHGVALAQLTSHDDEIEGLARTPGGGFFAVGVAGVSETNTAWNTQFGAARFTSAGKIDKSFASTGSLITKNGSYSFANGAAMTADGRAYGFGYTVDGGVVSAEVTRYLGHPPTVAMSPGAARVGDTFTISGTGFTADTTVKIGALAVPADDVDVVSDGDVVVDVPPGALTGKVTVSTVNGAATSAKAFGVLATVSSLDDAAPLTIGNQIGVSGNTFVAVKKVTVGGVSWPFHVDSPTHLTLTVPAAAIAGDIAVTNPGGTATSEVFVALVPTLKTFSPKSGAAGTLVTITGNSIGGAQVLFDGVAAVVKSATATKVTALVPPSAGVGPITIHPAVGSDLTSGTNFAPIPKITSITPGGQGESVTITGTNLGDATAVTFNGQPADFAGGTPLALTATVPAGPASGTWKVTTPGGTSAASATFKLRPTITSFSPAAAVTGTSITVGGTTFTGVSAVTIGGIAAKFTVASATQLTLTVPAAGVSGAIAIKNAGGTGTSADTFRVQPTLASFTPTTGKPGSAMTITGTGLGAVTSVVFDDGASDAVSATPSAVSATQVSVTVPAAAHSGDITVVGPDGDAASATAFTTTSSVSAISAAFVQAGGTLTITGAGLATATSVLFDDYSSSVATASDGTVTVVVPVARLGARTVTVLLADGTHVQAQQKVTVVYLSTQSLNSQGDHAFEVQGQGLSVVTGVEFKTGDGSWAAGSITSVSGSGGTQLDLTLPDGAVSGPIRLTDGDDDSLVSTVTYTIIGVATISEDSWSPGDVVTVTGSGLKNPNVYINGATCQVDSSATDGTSVSFTVPNSVPIRADYTLTLQTSYGDWHLAFPPAGAAPVEISPDRVAQGSR